MPIFFIFKAINVVKSISYGLKGASISEGGQNAFKAKKVRT